MQVTNAEVEASFRAETDEELMGLASSASRMTPEAREALLRELEARLAVPRPAGNIQKVLGWYSVSLPRGPIKFPNLCPRCLRHNPEKNISFTSNVEKKLFWWFAPSGESVEVQVPHCMDCARALLTDRRIALLMSAFLTVAAIVLTFIFKLDEAGAFVLLVLLWPVVVLYSRTPTVKLGECTDTEFEFRFKKTEYADAFAEINGVTAQNSDTIKEELSDAIKKVVQATRPV